MEIPAAGLDPKENPEDDQGRDRTQPYDRKRVLDDRARADAERIDQGQEERRGGRYDLAGRQGVGQAGDLGPDEHARRPEGR